MKALTAYLFSILVVFSTETNGKDPDPFSKLASEIKPSVVTISTTSRGGGSWGVGTGFVVGQNGVIATNFHVIGDHREFLVELGMNAGRIGWAGRELRMYGMLPQML